MLRDASDTALVMVDPELPGSGISGKEVAKTIKTSGQFGALPVVFVLHEGVAAPRASPSTGRSRSPPPGPPASSPPCARRWASPARRSEERRVGRGRGVGWAAR